MQNKRKRQNNMMITIGYTILLMVIQIHEFFTTRQHQILNANFEKTNKAITTSAFPRSPFFGFGQSDSVSTPCDLGKIKQKVKTAPAKCCMQTLKKLTKQTHHLFFPDLQSLPLVMWITYVLNTAWRRI